MKYIIDNQKITCKSDDLVVSGSKNLYVVEFDFSKDWDGFEKVAVFKTVGSSKGLSLLIEDGQVLLPSNVIAKSGRLTVGVCGTKDDIVKPTIWAESVSVKQGVILGDYIPEPDPDIYTQIMAKVSRAEEVANKANSLSSQAKTIANQAKNESDMALENSKQARDYAYDAYEISLAVAIMADAAKKASERAESNSNEAIDTANTAKANSEDAVNKAESSVVKANEAIEISKEAKDALNDKVDKKEGYSLLSNDEIERLATLHNYDDTELSQAIKDEHDIRSQQFEALNDNKVDKKIISNQASEDNPLVDLDFVNSSIATNTANYISNNGEPFESLDALKAYTGEVTNNDYAFVKGSDESGNVIYIRYKWDGTKWSEEYRLNNSSFTANQWSAINSGATKEIINSISDKVTKVPGKELSSNDYTTEEKNKLGGIEEGANKYILPSDVVHDENYIHTDNNYTDDDKLANKLYFGAPEYIGPES